MSIQAQFAPYGPDTPEFSLIGLETPARVVSIYDADTVNAVIPFQGCYFKFSVRLNGIDAPEMKSKDARLKVLARRARDRTFELATGQTLAPSANDAQESAKKKSIKECFEKNMVIVWLKCGGLDLYGRVLADVRKNQADAQTFSEVLLKEKLVYPYFGETKLTEAEQLAALDG
jgi:endonuclease YncB( thermonuclease family)